MLFCELAMHALFYSTYMFAGRLRLTMVELQRVAVGLYCMQLL
jgi:hypothetical protein